MDQEYVQGFMDKCAACGVDPIKLAQNAGSLEDAQNLPVPATKWSRRQNEQRPTVPPVEGKPGAVQRGKPIYGKR